VAAGSSRVSARLVARLCCAGIGSTTSGTPAARLCVSLSNSGLRPCALALVPTHFALDPVSESGPLAIYRDGAFRFLML